jgi:hypothetical protein
MSPDAACEDRDSGPAFSEHELNAAGDLMDYLVRANRSIRDAAAGVRRVDGGDDDRGPHLVLSLLPGVDPEQVYRVLLTELARHHLAGAVSLADSDWNEFGSA